MTPALDMQVLLNVNKAYLTVYRGRAFHVPEIGFFLFVDTTLQSYLIGGTSLR